MKLRKEAARTERKLEKSEVSDQPLMRGVGRTPYRNSVGRLVVNASEMMEREQRILADVMRS